MRIRLFSKYDIPDPDNPDEYWDISLFSVLLQDGN